MKAMIELENMEFRAFHGCCDIEKRVGNRFRVDVAIEAEIGKAAAHDTLEGTINYLTLFEVVRAEMALPSNTIEHVAARIIHAIKAAFPQALQVTARVAKLAPPLEGKVGGAVVTLVG